MIDRVMTILTSVLLLVAPIAAQPPTIDIGLVFGQNAAKIEQLQGQTGLKMSASEVVSFADTDNSLTPLKAGKDQVTFSKDGVAQLVANITVAPLPVQISLTRAGEPVVFTDEATPITVVSGDVVTLAVRAMPANGTITPATFDKPVASAGFVSTSTDGTIRFGALPNEGLINLPPTPVTVTFVTQDKVAHTLRFAVIEAIKTVRVDAPPALRENTTTVVPVTIIGTGGGTYHSTATNFSASYQYDCTLDVEKRAHEIVTATRPATATIQLSRMDVERLKDLNLAGVPIGTIRCDAQPVGRREKTERSEPKEVKIEPSGGAIVFVPPSLNVVAGQAATVRAVVFDRAGRANPDAKVTWSIVEKTDAAVLTPGAGNEASLLTLPDRGKLPEKGLLTIRASVPTSDPTGTALTADLLVQITSPSGFTRVTGGIELIDYQTAHDLYGAQTVMDFYVAKITLLNDLQDEPDRKLVGASILVFSSSLAIGVNMEKTLAIGTKPPRKDAKWEPVTFGDLRVLGLPMTYRIKSSEARPNLTPPKRDANGKIVPHELDDVPVYTCDDVWFAEQDIELTPEQEMLGPEAADALRAKLIRQRDAQVAAARLRQLHYRPYPYDMVVKSFDPRDARTARSKTFRALTFAGSVATFFTGVPNFTASNELVAVNEKFGNILIPALGVLWPSLKETQRQNLVSDTMHPIEEIPYASSLTKVVFLPKYPFPGFKRGYWFRISEVCPFNFQIDVAVAPKRTTETVPPAQQTTITPP